MKRIFFGILFTINSISVSVADAPKIIFYESFDNISANKPVVPEKGKPGEISGEYKSIEGRFGKGIYLSSGSSLKFPAKWNYNPLGGTIEFWVSRQIDLPAKTQYSLVSVDYGRDGKMKLYSRDGVPPTFVFWAADENDKALNGQEGSYRFILPSGQLSLPKGQWHHVAVIWDGKTQRIYFDGKMIRHMYFDGALQIKPEAIGQLEISGDGGFAIDEFRIWDKPRSPRKLSEKPSLEDATIIYPTQTRKLPDVSGMQKISGDGMAVYCDKDGAEFMISLADKQQWLHKPVSVSAVFGGKTFPAKLEWGSENGRIYCKTSIVNKSKSVSEYEVVLAAPVLRNGLTCFVAADECPFEIGRGRSFYANEHGADHGVSLPIASVYDVNDNVGISIINPDSMLGDVGYAFGSEGQPEDLMITHKGSLLPNETIDLKWYFVSHQADWRAALQKYIEINPSIMTPPRGPVARDDQGMVIGGPSTEEFIAPLRKLGVGWREVSLYLGKGAGFGNYIPDDLGPYMKAVDGYRQQIRDMHKNDLLAMMYIQARECKNVQRALKEFSASVVYKNGKPEIDRAGPFGVSMTARPGTKWFVHLEDQARRILKTFPDCDGFFFDNAWSTVHADIMNAIAKIAHDNGKSLTSNGANWASVGASDSIMAESAWYCLGDLQYLGLAKPIHYVPIYSYNMDSAMLKRLKRKDEKNLAAPGIYRNLMRDIKECLKSGAFYGFNYRGIKYWPAESRQLMEKYVIFQRMLNGRKWVLVPHVLELPSDLSGNIFELVDGRWMITLVNEGTDRTRSGVVKVLLPEDKKVKHIELKKLQTPEETSIVKYSQSGNNMEISVENIKDAAIILLQFENR